MTRLFGSASSSGPGFMSNILQPKLERAANESEQRYKDAYGDIAGGYASALGYQQPFYDYGTNALDRFKKWETDPNAIMSDPSYKFRLNQGQEGVENSAAARGGLLSGNALRGISDYNQQSASQEYSNEFQRWMNRLGIGQGAAANMSNLASGRAGALSNINVRRGDMEWNRMMQSAEAIRKSEETFNNILQSWVPASAGGGKPSQQSPAGGGDNRAAASGSSWNSWGSSPNFASYGGG